MGVMELFRELLKKAKDAQSIIEIIETEEAKQME